jgi:hypothetical protein
MWDACLQRPKVYLCRICKRILRFLLDFFALVCYNNDDDLYPSQKGEKISPIAFKNSEENK